MKRMLSALCFVIVATGCERLSPPIVPSPVPDGVLSSAVLSGIVTESSFDGAAPVADATVELTQRDVMFAARTHGKSSDARDVIVVSSTMTDAGGRYQFGGVSFGSYALRITKAGYATYESGDFQFSGDLDLSADLKLDGSGSDPAQPRRIRR